MWTVYLVRCADGSLYCGITNDLPARLAAHEAGKGAKYTRGRGPLVLVATRRCRDKGVALRIEHAVKKLARRDKQRLDAKRFAAIARAAREKQQLARRDKQRLDAKRFAAIARAARAKKLSDTAAR